jgi:hypothetical protein
MEKIRETKYFYEKNEIVYYITDSDDNVKSMTVRQKATDDHRWFELSKDFSGDIDGLKKYKDDFNRDHNQILTFTNYYTNYKAAYNHGKAIIRFYNSYTSKVIKGLSIENFNSAECITFEKCNNGALSYLDKNYINKVVKCYGYDFSMCYGRFLSDPSVSKLQISTEPGKYEKIKKFNIKKLDDLKFGIYNITIKSDDPIICKYFRFSKDNRYDIFALQQLQKLMRFCKKQNKDWKKPEITLNTTSEYNCLVYEKDDLVSCDVIFGKWFNEAIKMKNGLKGNMLVKNLTTKFWGHLTQFNRQFVDEDTIADMDYAFCEDVDETFTPQYLCINVKSSNTDKPKYELVDTNNPYKQGGIARVKPFLVSSVRKYITDMILDCGLHDHVIRICTDGIVLDCEHDFTKNSKDYPYFPIMENKTTGLIKFYNVNKFFHVCDKCGHEWKFNKNYVCDKCVKK